MTGAVTRPVARLWFGLAGLRPRLVGPTLRIGLPGIVAWSVALVLLIASYAAGWRPIRDSAAYQQVFDKLPDTYRALLGASGMPAATGYLSTELITATAVLVLLVAAITAGTRCVAGLERTGELETLLAHPISRVRWVIEQAMAVLLVVVIIAGMTTVALLAASALTRAGLGTGHVVATGVHLAVLASWFGLLAVAVGAGTGRPALTHLVCATVALAAYLVNDLGTVPGRLAALRSLSVFRWALADDPLATGLHPVPLAGVLSSAAMILLAGTTAFRRRDLRR